MKTFGTTTTDDDYADVLAMAVLAMAMLAMAMLAMKQR